MQTTMCMNFQFGITWDALWFSYLFSAELGDAELPAVPYQSALGHNFLQSGDVRHHKPPGSLSLVLSCSLPPLAPAAESPPYSVLLQMDASTVILFQFLHYFKFKVRKVRERQRDG